MSNLIEYNNKLAIHPGYYIEELIEELGISQEDYAKKLGTTPKNLSILLRGEQSLSADMAMKISRLTGTSIKLWTNLQSAYDAAMAEIRSEQETDKEKGVLKSLDYRFFRDHFRLPSLPHDTSGQVTEIRKFLDLASLTILEKPDLTVSFRKKKDQSQTDLIRTNAMVMIGMNETLKTKAPPYRRARFKEAVQQAAELTKDHRDLLPQLTNIFRESGVILVILPNMPGCRMNGASRRVGDKVMLVVTERRLSADTFWFTLFHEAGHILKSDFGLSSGDAKEEAADSFAQQLLIPEEKYQEFVSRRQFTRSAVETFAEEIRRIPEIVLGRLQYDGLVSYKDPAFEDLRHRYKTDPVI
ncbi:MAG: HigA family addiction module antidote protein [Erysipelotrichaceae bacterium]|nr:HigA family addiction module antidote protein [Erysipelotrichaceae bacterium]